MADGALKTRNQQEQKKDLLFRTVLVEEEKLQTTH